MKHLINIILITLASCNSVHNENDPWKIYWDENLIQGKNKYLEEKINSKNNPNIIIILVDDMGQTDLSIYGNKQIETPNIDAIGKNGLLFKEGYISSPVCSPSRAGILTGRYQQRFGHELQMNEQYVKNKFQKWWVETFMKKFKPLVPHLNENVPSDEERLRQGLPPSEITIADILKKYNYQTAIIGKWHLGAKDFALPCNRGFDYQYGFSEAYTLYANTEDTNIINKRIEHQFMDIHQWDNAKGRKGNCAITKNCHSVEEVNGYLTDVLTNEAINYINNSSRDKPFFIYLPYNAPHVPLQAQKYYYNLFSNIKDPVKRVYLAMIKNLDDQIGRLTKYLDSASLSENTIIFFLSDNGGASYNGTTDNFPYRGGKITNFEGGLRIPFMVQWKNKITPKIINEPVISLDILTTIASACNIELPIDRKYDGINLFDLDSLNYNRAIYWRSAENKAIRFDKWKMLLNEIDNKNKLYDLSNDIEEKNNLFDKNPEIVNMLKDSLNIWENEMISPLWPRTANHQYIDKYDTINFAF